MWLFRFGIFIAIASISITTFSQQVIEQNYNPDSDADTLIGTADLLTLISIYGSEFIPEPLMIAGQPIQDYLDSLSETVNAVITVNAEGQIYIYNGANFQPLPPLSIGLAQEWDQSEWTVSSVGCQDSTACNYAPQSTYFFDEICDFTGCAENCANPSLNGYTYDVVYIGNQCWFAENLRTTQFNNGEEIPNLSCAESVWWGYSGTVTDIGLLIGGDGISCTGNDNGSSSYETRFGEIYKGYVVTDNRNVCPVGWHVPLIEEWEVLLNTTDGAIFSSSGWDGTVNEAGSFEIKPAGHGNSPSSSFGLYWTDSYGQSTGIGQWRLLGLEVSNLAGGSIMVDDVYPYFGGAIRCISNEHTGLVYGCTDSNFLEYDASANIDNGSCETPIVYGCTDPLYTEYEYSANIDDGSCNTLVVLGCTLSNYIEYNPMANTNDNSCVYQVITGCTNTFNYYGVTYKGKQVGNQCWLSKDLRTDKFNNGVDIVDASQYPWGWLDSGSTPQYVQYGTSINGTALSCESCDYSNRPCEGSFYYGGYLYNYATVTNTYNVCPAGWHVATNLDWNELEEATASIFNVDQNLIASYLRSTNPVMPSSGSTSTLSYGAGFCSGNTVTEALNLHAAGRIVPGAGNTDTYEDFGEVGYYWVDPVFSGQPLTYRYISGTGLGLFSYSSDMGTVDPHLGMSIRCVKDE